MNEVQLREQLGAVGLSHIADRVIDMSRLTVQLRTTAQSADLIGIGASKIGGLPDLPATLAWPTWHDKPQAFVAQFNLVEIALYTPPGILPEQGMLYFFYDLWEQPWGFHPKHRGAGRVIYFDGDPAVLERRPAPPGPHDPLYAAPFTACSVTYSSELSLPSCFSARLDNLALNREEQRRYHDWWLNPSREPTPYHQLLGLPNLIQGDMEMECQLASNGVNAGDPKAWDNPRHAHLEAVAPDWQLLLQVESDPAPDMEWGDVGRIYYWIRRQDLEARNFADTWLILQCT